MAQPESGSVEVVEAVEVEDPESAEPESGIVEVVEVVEKVEVVEVVEVVEKAKEVEKIPVVEKVEELIAFEPYHMVDYFASQGIKLGLAEQKDELSNKVKSFTAWLKTMKNLQPLPDNSVSRKKDGEDFNKSDHQSAPKEAIITESMAEVFVKQGLFDKAIDIYNKLSLQNPSNSHIFANRIISIKANKL